MRLPFLPALTALLLAGAAHAQSPLTLERITADPPLAGRLPRQAEISPGGRWVSYLQPSASDSEVLELWAQPTDGGAPRKLVAAADLLAGQAQRLSEAEKMALERKRINQRGIVEYQWCGTTDQQLLFPLSGELYLVRLGGTGPVTQKLADDAPSPKQDLACTRDGQQVAFVRDNNLWTLDLRSDARPRALTSDGEGAVSWGLAEFIAAEELGRFKGYWWSPDGRSLLALRVDEGPVGLKTRARIEARGTSLTEQRYPAAGEPNAQVSAWVIDARTGARRALPLPAHAEYISRAGWFQDGTPWLQWLTRDQTRLTLTAFDPAPRDLLTETDPQWVEVHDDLAELPAGLLWSSEASGRRQLEQVDRQSGRRQGLTHQDEPVAHVVCANRERVVFAAATDRGKGQELYVLADGKTRPLAGAGAQQWREAKADAACTRLLVTQSRWGQPPRLELRDIASGRAVALPGDTPDPVLATLPPPQSLDLQAADGQTLLNAFWFAPQRGSGPRPVLVLAYGGPGAATVSWSYARDTPLIAYWQRRGYGVLMVDTRGMAHRDRAFNHAHYRAFGEVEVADLFAAVRQLPRLAPEADPQRMAFFGWSYGGFLAARAVLDADTPFAAAIAVAPVTDWTLYDTAYTERYLGLPEGGRAAPYVQADLPSRAKLLTRPLLLMHGTADDNVFLDHSLRLIEALQNEGKLFDTALYPGKAHGIAGRATRLHLYRTMEAFLDRHLKP